MIKLHAKTSFIPMSPSFSPDSLASIQSEYGIRRFSSCAYGRLRPLFFQALFFHRSIVHFFSFFSAPSFLEKLLTSALRQAGNNLQSPL